MIIYIYIIIIFVSLMFSVNTVETIFSSFCIIINVNLRKTLVNKVSPKLL